MTIFTRFIQWIQNEEAAEPLENNGVGWTKTWAKQYWWCTKRLRRPTKYANLPKCWGRAIFSLILSCGVIDLEIFPKCHPSLVKNNSKFSPTFWFLSLLNMQIVKVSFANFLLFYLVPIGNVKQLSRDFSQKRTFFLTNENISEPDGNILM